MRSAWMRMRDRAVRVVIGQHGVLEIVAGQRRGCSARPVCVGRWLGELNIQVLTPSAIDREQGKDPEQPSERARGARAQQRIAQLAHRARAAGQRAHPMRGRLRPAGARPPPPPRSPTAVISGKSGVSSTMQAQFKRVDPEPLGQIAQRRDLVRAALDHVGTPSSRMRAVDGRRAPAAERRHRHAAVHQQLDAVAVAHVERLERLAARREIQPPVGQYAVDVQDQRARSSRASGRRAVRAVARRPCGRLQNDSGAQQIVHVERTDQHFVRVDARSAR